jgi:two-component system osmolarity sensor histidine kinase EnvZ
MNSAQKSPVAAFKRLLPRTLFGRALLIIVTPLLLMQAVTAYVFYERHWDTLTRRLVSNLAGDIGLIVRQIDPRASADSVTRLNREVAGLLDFTLRYTDQAVIAEAAQTQVPADYVETVLRAAMARRVERPYALKMADDDRQLIIQVQLENGVLDVITQRKRVYSSTTYIFILWMLGSSLVLFAVAIVFMRNQIRPIRRLAAAARNFGLGRDGGNIAIEGATEVRQAAVAFSQMRDRIQRQLTERTEMLAGVSHDLRTPLTRMKLQLAMIGETDGVDELQSDVADMEHMVEGYLAFARGEGGEPVRNANLAALASEIVDVEARAGRAIDLLLPAERVIEMPVRANALKRALTNLTSNACRYGEKVLITVEGDDEHIDFIVEDDGPGIPADRRNDVFRPFVRLDTARNPQTGGIGLGLTIARSIAREHGGDLWLEESVSGGLKATIRLPI